MAAEQEEKPKCPISFVKKMSTTDFSQDKCPVMMENPAPLATQIIINSATYAMYGGLAGIIFFRSKSFRKASFIYGAGIGLGLSAHNLRNLSSAFWENRFNRDTEFRTEIDEIQKELELRV
jgi:hypothetical protein